MTFYIGGWNSRCYHEVMLNEDQKTRLWRTIDRMDRLEKIELMHRITRSLGESQRASGDVSRVIEQMRKLREGTVLGDDLSARDLIDEGRWF